MGGYESKRRKGRWGNTKMSSRAGVVEDVCNGRGTMFCFAYTFKEKILIIPHAIY